MAASKKAPGKLNWRWVMVALVLAVLGVSTGMAALKVRQYVITGSQFVLSRDNKDAFTVLGLNYASRWKVERVFAADFERSIFAIPLAERRRRLLAIDWVEDASVSRVWPDRLVVRVRERKPVAFVSLRSGVLLIDAYGVLLEAPARAQFAFPVLGGVREDETEPQRRERVRALLRIKEELGDLAKDVSEVDAGDPDNIRIMAQAGNRTVELMMGDGNFGRRYQNFLNHYPEIQKRSPGVRAFDLRLDDRITAKEH